MTDLPNLDALEAVARAATPGPWHQGAHYIGAGGEPYDPEAFVGQASILCDAEHIAAFDPPTVRALITRLREAEALNDAARAVHHPVDALNTRYGRRQQVCAGCGTDDGNWMVWPCPTTRALTKAEGRDQ